MQRAQEPEAPTRPAFSLASSQIYTTKDSPSIDLTFQMVEHLDFRIYRVKDAKAFFAGLKDPHQFGSPEPVVPQEQTWLEWLASWKSEPPLGNARLHAAAGQHELSHRTAQADRQG